MYMYTVWSDQAYLYSVLYNVELHVYIIFSPFRLSNLFIIILYEVIIRCPKLSHHYRAVLNFQKKISGPAGPQVFSFGRQDKYSSHQELYLRINGIQ